MAEANCAESGGTLTITDDVVAAVREADFLYTDLWWWVGQEDQIPERRAAFMPLPGERGAAGQSAAALQVHALPPASRGVEVTDEVMDSAAIHHLTTRAKTGCTPRRALLVWLVYPRLQRPSAELRA